MGLSYGELADIYMKWLVGDAPDLLQNEPIAFVRGSARGSIYRETAEVPIGSRFSLNDPDLILDKTGLSGYTVQKNKSIVFGSSVFSFFAIGMKWNGKTLESPDEIRRAVMWEMNTSPAVFANIYYYSPSSRDDSPGTRYKIFENKEEFQESFILSPLSTLFVPPDSLLADKFDTPLEVNKDYQVCLFGSFFAIRFTENGMYRLDCGGIGVPQYVTRTVVDFDVIDAAEPRIKDISDLMAKDENRYAKTRVLNTGI